jgi:hypothetical protein
MLGDSGVEVAPEVLVAPVITDATVYVSGPLAVAVTVKEFVSLEPGPLYGAVCGVPGVIFGGDGTSVTVTVVDAVRVLIPEPSLYDMITVLIILVLAAVTPQAAAAHTGTQKTARRKTVSFAESFIVCSFLRKCRVSRKRPC